MKSSSSRYALLDELRGLDLISMMLYHGMWDAVYLFGVVVPWYSAGQGRLWQQSICWVFILLSGFCLPLGHHPLKRGAAVFGAGALVTAVTLLFMPEDVVWFGVLTLLGSAMLLTGLVQKWLQKIPPAVGLAVSLILFALTDHTMDGYWGLGPLRWALPQGLYANYLTAYLVFYPVSFYSSDYFPLLPWGGLFLAGCYAGRWLLSSPRRERLQRSRSPGMAVLGRHTLPLYLLHQPVWFGVLALLRAAHG